MAEFARNTNTLSITGVSLFFANKGYHPRMSFDFELPIDAKTAHGRIEQQKAVDIATQMKDI